MPPTFVLVRHAEAEHNIGFLEEGESAYKNPKYKDSHLTKAGIEQAIKTREQLSHLSFLSTWSSPLSRCIETATYLNNGNQIMFLHDNLLERLGGEHVCNERKTKTEIKRMYPECSTMFLPDSPAVWSEREGKSSLYSRMFGFIAFLRELYGDKPETDYVLVVTHHDVIERLTEVSLKNCEYIFIA